MRTREAEGRGELSPDMLLDAGQRGRDGVDMRVSVESGEEELGDEARRVGAGV